MIHRTTFAMAILFATSAVAEQTAKPLHVGDKVPNFTVTALNGKQFKLSDLQKNKDLTKNGVIVFTFWCSFCDSCRHVERPLNTLANEFKGKALVFALDSSFGETAEARSVLLVSDLSANGVGLDPLAPRRSCHTPSSYWEG